MVKITVQYDSQLKRYSECDQEDLEVPEQCTLHNALKQASFQGKDDFAKRVFNENDTIQPTLLVFVNDEVIRSDDITNRKLNNGDVVSLFTPISGG